MRHDMFILPNNKKITTFIAGGSFNRRIFFLRRKDSIHQVGARDMMRRSVQEGQAADCLTPVEQR